MNLYFPRFYDIKYLIKDFENLKDDGLNKLAANISVILYFYCIFFQKTYFIFRGK